MWDLFACDVECKVFFEGCYTLKESHGVEVDCDVAHMEE